MQGVTMAARNKPAGQTQRERDAIALGLIESELDRMTKEPCYCPSCAKELQVKDIAPRLQAMKMRYDRLRPTLVAQELTVIEPDRSEADILAELQALVAANPDLIRSLLATQDAIIQAQTQPQAIEAVIVSASVE